jgi:hypothetical protein
MGDRNLSIEAPWSRDAQGRCSTSMHMPEAYISNMLNGDAIGGVDDGDDDNRDPEKPAWDERRKARQFFDLAGEVAYDRRD